MKYRVLTAYNLSELQQLVEDYLKDGFELAGGITSIRPHPGSSPTTYEFIQAVYKKETL